MRRALGSTRVQEEVEHWWRPAAAARGYSTEDVDRIWEVLKAFASFGFCKAHAAAFALPTYQSAWLKTHHPAAFLAGVLTHDPGMYPKRLILDDARAFGIGILGLDVNASTGVYRFERDETGRPGIRLSLADVHGISETHIAQIVPFMADAGLHHLPVVDEAGHLVGMVTQSDVMAAMFAVAGQIGAEPRPGASGPTPS